jgi:hypothetical protein
MVDLRPPQGEVIKVQQVFEKSRVERVVLTLAYERIVPIRRCPVRSMRCSRKRMPPEGMVFLQPTVGVGA